MIWAAAQTEPNPPSIVLLGNGWPPLIAAVAANLVVGPADLDLLRIVATPEEAIQALTVPADRGRAPGPRG